MLYLLQDLFINSWGVLRIFKSIMLRASVAFMIAFLFATAIAGNFTNKFIVFLFIITILFTTIGFYDDYLKLTRHKNGLSGKKKILGQMIITALTFWFVYKYGLVNKTIDFSIVNPIIKNSYFYITPILFFVFIAFVNL